MKAHEEKLMTSEQEMYNHIVNICRRGENVVSKDYIVRIVEKIIKPVMEDMAASADGSNWNDDDIRMAVGRVLCKKLRIEI